jgi:diketogulonate reductase-like aldo/keto reductase
MNIPTIKLNNGMTMPCIGMGTFGSDHAGGRGRCYPLRLQAV